MNDETPINRGDPAKRRKRGLPEPIEAAGFAFQERVVWPLQDRFGHRGTGPHRTALIGGGAALFLAGVAIVFALASGGGSSDPSTTAAQAPAQREPLIAAASDPVSKSKPKEETPQATLHGAAPVFSPPSPASKGGEKTGESKAAAAGTAAKGGSGSNSGSGSGQNNASAGAAGDEATSESTGQPSPSSSSPADARISSNPKSSEAAGAGNDATATAARAVPAGPPAGPAALKVAREFAKGFVVYETGGEASAFRNAFAASATPELRKALLQRPPKQPSGVKVPRAKVLNVVAGPSRGNVYEVSVSLLRVGVTSELRLDMEKVRRAGRAGGDEKDKRAEWRVTNVLG